MSATDFKLHNPNWRSVITTAPVGDCVAGVMGVIGDCVGIYPTSEDAGDTVAFVHWAEHVTVPCETATTGDYALLTKVYYDSTNKRVTQTASANVLCGIVKKAASVGDTTVEIELDGKMAIVA